MVFVRKEQAHSPLLSLARVLQGLGHRLVPSRHGCQQAERGRHSGAPTLAAIIHRGRIFAWVRTVVGVHDLHAQPEFSPQG